MSLPPLGAFRVFDIAARTESFVRAAELMHVTHGAVSRQIRLLEEALGVELFERRNRAVFLTAAGRTLHLTTTVIFEQLEATVHRLRQQANEDILVVSCEPTIAMKWLIPRLPAFQLAHPDIQLHLSAAGGPIDFAKAGVDVALRRDDFRWATTLHATRICDEWMGPVTAPRNQSPSSNLDCARLLHTASRPTAWNTWLRLSNVSARDSTQGNYEHFYLCIRAAVAGLGTAMASYFMVQEELVGGQLVAPFGFLKDRSSYYLLTLQPLSDNTNARRFAEWVADEMYSCVSAMPGPPM